MLYLRQPDELVQLLHGVRLRFLFRCIRWSGSARRRLLLQTLSRPGYRRRREGRVLLPRILSLPGDPGEQIPVASRHQTGIKLSRTVSSASPAAFCFTAPVQSGHPVVQRIIQQGLHLPQGIVCAPEGILAGRHGRYDLLPSFCKSIDRGLRFFQPAGRFRPLPPPGSRSSGAGLTARRLCGLSLFFFGGGTVRLLPALSGPKGQSPRVCTCCTGFFIPVSEKIPVHTVQKPPLRILQCLEPFLLFFPFTGFFRPHPLSLFISSFQKTQTRLLPGRTKTACFFRVLHTPASDIVRFVQAIQHQYNILFREFLVHLP